MFANIPNMATSFDNMQLTMGYDQNTKEETTETLNNIIMIPVAIGFFFVTEPLLLVFVLRMFNELEHMLDLMAKLDDQTKQEASKLLKRDSGEEEQNEKLSDTAIPVAENAIFMGQAFATNVGSPNACVAFPGPLDFFVYFKLTMGGELVIMYRDTSKKLSAAVAHCEDLAKDENVKCSRVRVSSK